MTRVEVLRGATWRTILKIMLTPSEAEAVKDEVREFFAYNTGLPIEARNGVLIKVIMLKGSNFNSAYLRKVQETFIARKLFSAPVIIDYFDRAKDYERAGRKEPDWYKQWHAELAALEN